MAVIVQGPLSAPSITATLSAGGSFVNGATYHFMVTARNSTTYSNNGRLTSGKSNVVSVTMDAVNKSVLLEWNPVAGASAYTVYNCTTSGSLNSNWAKSPDYILTLSTTGTTYLITAPGVGGPWDTCGINMQNYSNSALPVGISHELGRIIVSVSGTETLANIAKVITASGYGDFIRYSDSMFAIKGNIYCTDTGSLTITKTDLHFLDGGTITNNSANFVLTYGAKDANGVVHSGCSFNHMGGELNLNYAKTYNCKMINRYASYGYVWQNGGWTCNLAGSEVVDLVAENVSISNNTGMTGVTFNSYNNQGKAGYGSGYTYYRCKWNPGFIQEWLYTVYYRECEFNRGYYRYHHTAGHSSVLTNGLHFYDCTFDTSDNLPVVNYTSTNDKQNFVYYSYNVSVVDKDNRPIPNARLIIENKNGVVHNRVLTNGSISDLDVLIWNVHNNVGAGGGYTNNLKESYGPVTYTIVASGYKTHRATYTPTAKQNIVVVLDSSAYGNMSRR